MTFPMKDGKQSYKPTFEVAEKGKPLQSDADEDAKTGIQLDLHKASRHLAEQCTTAPYKSAFQAYSVSTKVHLCSNTSWTVQFYQTHNAVAACFDPTLQNFANRMLVNLLLTKWASHHHVNSTCV